MSSIDFDYGVSFTWYDEYYIRFVHLKICSIKIYFFLSSTRNLSQIKTFAILESLLFADISR